MVGEASMGESAQNETSLLSTLPKELPLEFFTEITSGFSKDRILRASAFGTFYTGILQNGLVVCVKKLAENLQIPAGRQFDNEATNLLVAQHENIVKLLGFCRQITKKVVEHNARFILVDKDECVLCYEHVPRGSLRDYLSDDKMVPKIADFGLSRFFNREQSRLYTINVAGLKGYMAPEYLQRGEISWQCDIYSLGVLIIEITTREKNCCDDKDKSGREYISSVRRTWTDEHITIKYMSLDADRLQQVKACIDIGFKCVDVNQKNRPSTVEIVDRLHGKRAG
ncbi:cysteine-rich receptor-like protein kinase 44 isoform X2 [Miscanthus floridulus]|uniref:cysteine-rich receptor-like protein kinase 44 isoform X2 n=1 Tax=Miscanthus floridulus TaxID=154761 RepID=UPI003459FEB5